MPDTANVATGDVLSRICSDTRAQVALAKSKTSLDTLRSRIGTRGNDPRGFGSALKQAVAEGLAPPMTPEQIAVAVQAKMWEPVYARYRRLTNRLR